jgi:hypothetical protein
MKRILPLRDYDEHDVINLFALNTANNAISDSGAGDNGVIVKVVNGAISNEAVQYVSSAYLGKTDYPYVGRNQYPEVPLKVGVASSGDAAIGITLFETAMYDENGEKLLYYRQKALENQIVLSGQAVPVLTQGTVMLADSAFDAGTIPSVMSRLAVRNNGKFGSAGAGEVVVGKVLAVGSRVAGLTSDYFAGAPSETGNYALVRIDFN